MKSVNFTYILILMLFAIMCDSCQIPRNLSTKNKEAKKNADSIYASIINARESVYDKVKAIKKDTTIKGVRLDSLKNQYKTATTKFNSTFSQINRSVDSMLVRKGSCIAFSYKRVLIPYESEFKKASNEGDIFIANATKELHQAAAGCLSWWCIAWPIIKTVADDRIRVCKAKIDEMAFKKWEDVK